MKMKRSNLAVLTSAMVVVLAACSTPAPTTVIGFNYDIENAKANGVVQVFDLRGSTVVQVRDLDRKSTHFLDSKNAPISFKVIGENVVLEGIQSSFTVSTAAGASRVIRKSTAPVTQPVAVVSPAVIKPISAADSDAEIVTEIARMRKELAELRAILAAGATRSPAPNAPAVAVLARGDAAEPKVVIVSFLNNSRQFSPANEQRSQLLALSHGVGNISVRGYTDSDLDTLGSTALAKARAEAAKRYLVSMGVSAAKIIVGFDGAGKFIAENGSPAGRAANRRVEISGT
jgi:outer membrane protein OmpA-like peptidoglycan-associated protein